jgi:hypothetical protein
MKPMRSKGEFALADIFQSIIDGMRWYCLDLDDAGRQAYLQHPDLFSPSYVRALAPEIGGMLGRPEGLEFFKPCDLINFSVCGDPAVLISMCIYPLRGDL